MGYNMVEIEYEWDSDKEKKNVLKHGINFTESLIAFEDPNRVIIIDEKHSCEEIRYYCFGKVREKILTIRFLKREGKIRIIGAGFWRKGRAIYEEENKI
jgi:hypothetical protein